VSYPGSTSPGSGRAGRGLVWSAGRAVHGEEGPFASLTVQLHGKVGRVLTLMSNSLALMSYEAEFVCMRSRATAANAQNILRCMNHAHAEGIQSDASKAEDDTSLRPSGHGGRGNIDNGARSLA